MWQNVWRSALLWELLQEEPLSGETSDPGDMIILLGGRTGRDGCGGATGSSKVHTEESIETCGAEVQKGNAPTERRSRDCSGEKKSARSLRSATTSVQAAYL